MTFDNIDDVAKRKAKLHKSLGRWTQESQLVMDEMPMIITRSSSCAISSLLIWPNPFFHVVLIPGALLIQSRCYLDRNREQLKKARRSGRKNEHFSTGELGKTRSVDQIRKDQLMDRRLMRTFAHDDILKMPRYGNYGPGTLGKPQYQMLSHTVKCLNMFQSRLILMNFGVLSMECSNREMFKNYKTTFPAPTPTSPIIRSTRNLCPRRPPSTRSHLRKTSRSEIRDQRSVPVPSPRSSPATHRLLVIIVFLLLIQSVNLQAVMYPIA